LFCFGFLILNKKKFPSCKKILKQNYGSDNCKSQAKKGTSSACPWQTVSEHVDFDFQKKEK
jgi:hypothetical protein